MQQFEEIDLTVIQRARAGDEAAFEAILQRYKRPVLNFVYRLLGDATEAEDVAQDVFVRVYRRLGDYDEQRKFSTWMFAVAHHACVDHLRWRKRHPVERLDCLPAAVEPRQASVTAEVSAREIGQHIAAALAELPEEQRTALVLAEYHGLGYAEIAAVMNCSVKAVESRLYRAKQALRVKLRCLYDA